MVIIPKVTISGVEYTDMEKIFVNKSLSSNNVSSNFEVMFDNCDGRYAGTFSINDTVQIDSFDEKTATSFDLTFPFSFTDNDILIKGNIETINYIGGGSTKEQVLVKGRNAIAKLMDTTVEPVVYNDQEIADIVKDIIANNTTGITTTNVNDTGITLERKNFNHTPVFDALRELAQRSSFIFYIDNDNDLHFEAKGSVDSGLVFNNTNLFLSSLKKHQLS